MQTSTETSGDHHDDKNNKTDTHILINKRLQIHDNDKTKLNKRNSFELRSFGILH